MTKPPSCISHSKIRYQSLPPTEHLHMAPFLSLALPWCAGLYQPLLPAVVHRLVLLSDLLRAPTSSGMVKNHELMIDKIFSLTSTSDGIQRG